MHDIATTSSPEEEDQFHRRGDGGGRQHHDPTLASSVKSRKRRNRVGAEEGEVKEDWKHDLENVGTLENKGSNIP